MLQPRVLTTGHAFGESPRWHNDRLWFSDWGEQEILAVELEGHVETVVRVDFPSFPMCIDFLRDGRLLIVSGRDGRLLRRESDGSLVTHADLSTLSRHPWNDLVVDGRGSTFINEAGFAFPAGEFAPGTIAQVTPDGSVRLAADGLAFPNGMAIAPDNSTLIVAESYGNQLTALDITADGSLSDRRVWADLGDGVPDGICLDAEGAVWYGDVPNKRCVRVRAGGDILETIALDRGCFACALGGRDGSTLFMVAQEWGSPGHMRSAARTGQLLITQAPAPHAGWP